MPRWRLFVVIGLAFLVAIGLLTITGVARAPWSPQPTPPAQEAVVPTPVVVPPRPTPAPAPAPTRQAVRAATGATTTVASITRVTTATWAYECRLDTLEKPECDWVLKEAKTETKVGEPSVSVVAPTVTATPTVMARATSTPTPTVTATAVPTPTTTPRPAAAAPAPQVAPTPVKESPGPPPPQLEPSYRETGKGQTHVWTLAIGADKALIVGGYRVDGRGPGVYKAYQGGQTVTVTVTDGFATIVEAGFASQQFCFRVGQARQYGWDHSIVEPLPGWPAC